MHYDHHFSQTLHKLGAFPPQTDSMRLILVFAALIAAHSAGSEPAVTACDDEGHFAVQLYGDLRTELSWAATDLTCEGMPRPFGNGARLRFAGTASVDGSDRQLAFIVALPALEPGKIATELVTTITLIEENSGRFYSNQDSEICWSDVTAQQALDDSGEQYAVTGIAYCLAPLAELNGNGSVTIRELSYSGRVNWQAAK